MKIMSLNIGQYLLDWKTGKISDWEKRKECIVRAVMEEKPDVLFLQEVSDDQRYQENDGAHQGEQLNMKLNYKNMIYDIVEQRRAEGGQELKQTVFDGLLCLTNLEILRHKIVRLKKEETDKHYRGIQIIEISHLNERFLFYNTHYSNTSEWSELQLSETQKYLVSKNEWPIILGILIF